MRGHLPPQVRRERLERLLEAGRESLLAFRRGFLGRTLDVLWEQNVHGNWQGLTGNYLRVYTAADCDLTNRLLPARLIRLEGDRIIGVTEVVEDAAV